MPFLSPDQQCQSTEGNIIAVFTIFKFTVNLLLHCALSLVAQCIVIGPVCGCVCGSVTTILMQIVFFTGKKTGFYR